MTPEQLKALQEAIKTAVDETAPGAVATAVEEKTADLTADFKAIKEQFTQLLEDSKFTDTGKQAEKAEQVEIAGKILRGLLDENSTDDEGQKTLTNTVDSTGGALLPVEFHRTLMKEVEKGGIARRYCRIIPMGSNTKSIPSLTGSITAYVVAGGVAITPSNPTFETLTLTARKFAVLVHAWNELLDDNATNQDVFDLVIELAGDAFAVLEDTQVFTGDGTGTNFAGILEDANVNVVTLTGGISTITYQKIVDLIMSVKIRYKRGKKPIFVMSQLAFGEVLKIVDSQGRPILVQDPTNPVKYILMGYPVEITDTFGTTVAVSTDYILFGDLKYYAMGDRKAVTAETGYTDTNFAKDIKSLRVISRVAGVMIFGEAFGKIVSSA